MAGPRNNSRAIPILLVIAVLVAGGLTYACSWDGREVSPETLDPSDALEYEAPAATEGQ